MESLENKGDQANIAATESPRIATAGNPSRPVATNREDVSDVEFERGILDAIRMGLPDVAQTLDRQLRARQSERAGNVVGIGDAKRRTR